MLNRTNTFDQLVFDVAKKEPLIYKHVHCVEAFKKFIRVRCNTRHKHTELFTFRSVEKVVFAYCTKKRISCFYKLDNEKITYHFSGLDFMIQEFTPWDFCPNYW